MRGALRAVAFGAACATGAVAQAQDGLSAQDRAAVAAVSLAYRDAWLANKPGAVMATLTPDAVLLPSGLKPVSGEAAIRNFWWPAGGPPVTIIEMEQVIDEISGDGSVAVVRGHGSLSFSMVVNGREETRSQCSTFLNIVRRQPSGRWLIAERMWSDLK